jgi:hypothetical protein
VILDSGSGILDAGYGMLREPGYWMLDFIRYPETGIWYHVLSHEKCGILINIEILA